MPKLLTELRGHRGWRITTRTDDAVNRMFTELLNGCDRHRTSSDPELINLGYTSFDGSIHGDAVAWRDDDEVTHAFG